MKLYIGITLLVAICQPALAINFNMTCYYDTFSINRLGLPKFKTRDLENALPMCDNIVYGYVGIRPRSFEVTTLHPLQHKQFKLVKTLKKKYRNVKFILSVGGDKDLKNYEKYLELLEANAHDQSEFINSAVEFVRKYQFDGFDLAYQLPRNFTYNEHPYISRKTEYHRQQMTKLIKNLGLEMSKFNLTLALTVLPNIDAKSYYNATAIIGSLDFITLAAFDFSLAKHSPREANYLAAMYMPINSDVRFKHANVNYQMEQWFGRVPTTKLNLGIAAFGRTWNTTQPLTDPQMPIRDLLNGTAPGGLTTRNPGLLAWPEICTKLANLSNVSDKMLGNYAYSAEQSKGGHGILIAYESPENALEKVTYAHRYELHGVALFDLSLDDFRGKCQTEKFPMLRTIRGKLSPNESI